MSWVFEYIRLCCYALVGIISIFHLSSKKDVCVNHKYHILTDLIISFGLFSSVLGFLFLRLAKDDARNYILTPLAILWTAIIFYKFLKK